MHLNVEFKAKCNNPAKIKEILEGKNARYVGKDHQVDVYFKTSKGRLKLRKGLIENNLIAYERENYSKAKQSKVILLKTEHDSPLEEMLSSTLGILAVVDKMREIYFIDNVKFHVDQVKDLGSFLEVEAVDLNGNIGKVKLEEQCGFYRGLFGVKDCDLIAESYSDMIIKLKEKLA